MKIGIIGAGNVGMALAKAFAGKGHEVVLGTRDGKDRDGVKGTTVRGAVEAAEVLVLSTPWAAIGDALGEAGDFAGKVLVDATNPIGAGFSLASDNGAAEVARIAKNARVVKAFNTMGFEVMANPDFGGRRAALFTAGDDPAANEVVARLGHDIGFEPVSLPRMSHARALEAMAMLWIRIAIVMKQGRDRAFGIVRRTGPVTEVSTRAAKPHKIAVIGSGNIGGALAAAWQRAGHDVFVPTREQTDGAANGRDVVALAIPAGAVAEVIGKLGSLDGKIVIDCTNAIGPGMTANDAAAALQKRLPNARVVKSFNQQGVETLRAPIFDGGVAATDFVAGDDQAAREVVLSLARDVGLDAVDGGPLASARSLEWLTIAWIAASQVLGTREFGLTMLRR